MNQSYYQIHPFAPSFCKRPKADCLYVLMLILFVTIFAPGCTKEDSQTPEHTIPAYVLRDVEFGINYDTAGQAEHLLLDIYFPASDSLEQKFPLVLMMHGGSYLNGDKSWISKSCEILADSGFITVSMNYRMGWRTNGGCDKDTFSLREAGYRGMQDANSALSFLLANTGKYAVDPDWIFAGGESAGAAIALNISFTSNADMELLQPDLVAKLGKLQDPGYSLSNQSPVKGICNKWGSISDSNLIRTNNAIPVISFHGTNDPLVPDDTGYFLACPATPSFGSLCIYRRLLAEGGVSILHLKQGGAHQPDAYCPEFTMSKTALFFHQIMAGKAQSAVFIE